MDFVQILVAFVQTIDDNQINYVLEGSEIDKERMDDVNDQSDNDENFDPKSFISIDVSEMFQKDENKIDEFNTNNIHAFAYI